MKKLKIKKNKKVKVKKKVKIKKKVKVDINLRNQKTKKFQVNQLRLSKIM